MAKNAVATTSDAPPLVMSDQLPDFLKGQTISRGSDNFDATDVVIPRIKLIQGISPEMTAFDEAKAGVFWHSGFDVPLGSEFKFVVADRRKKFLLSAPIEDGQGVLARSDDAKTWDRLGTWNVKIKGVRNPVRWEVTDKDVARSGLTKWGTYNPDDPESPPAATMFYDYLVFLPERLNLGPAVISLSRSSIRQAKKGLNDKIALHSQNGRPMQALVFSANSIDDMSDGQSYKNWQFKSAGFVQDQALYEMVRAHAGGLGNVKVADEVEPVAPTADMDPDAHAF